MGLAEVIRAAFGPFVPQSELEDSFIEALSDERLVLLIDGLDEYSDEQAARTTLATIETFVRTRDVLTIATARPGWATPSGPDERVLEDCAADGVATGPAARPRDQAPERGR